MEKKNIKLVITDLDNTLYDWFIPWYKSFRVMLDEVLEHTAIEEKTLLSDIKKIHEKHGTSEYAFDFLLKELTILKDDYPEKSEQLEELRHKFYKTKKDYLKLYPGVLDTLLILKSKGCKIVGFTESMEFYSKDRVKKLGLDGILDFLYSPSDHDIPEDFERYHEKSFYDLKATKYIQLPLKHKKPDVEVINDILETIDIKVELDEVIYIGDSLTKDISMAQEAKINDVYAEYGVSNHKNEYELLKSVTHWTKEEVDKEKTTKKEHIEPTYTLHASFSEIFNYFTFEEKKSFEEKESCDKKESLENSNRLDGLIKIWDRTVDVQMHFNELSFKVRQFAISLSSLILGGIFALVVTGKIEAMTTFNSLQVYTLSLGFYFSAVIWLVFYFVDRHWYHVFLKGSGIEASDIEKEIKKYLPINGLSNTIGKYSKYTIPCTNIEILNSNLRLTLFYGSIISILVILGYILD